MIEKPCKCGKSKKSFKFDIGPFYVGECCEAAELAPVGAVTSGYLATPNSAPGDSAPPVLTTNKQWFAPVAQSPEAIAKIIADLGLKPSKTALRVHTVAVLSTIARQRGLDVSGLSRKQILALLTTP